MKSGCGFVHKRLEAHLAGCLDPRTAAKLEDHLRNCSPCAREHDRARGVASALSTGVFPPLALERRRAIVARLRAELVSPTTTASAASQLIAFALAAIGTAAAAWTAWDAGWLGLPHRVPAAALAIAAVSAAACAGLAPLLCWLRREGVDRPWSD